MLAQRAPALRLVCERRGAQHDERQPGARLDPVLKPAAALELDHQLDLAVRVGEDGVGALAAGQTRVDGHAADGISERPP